MAEQYSVEAFLKATDQGFTKTFSNAERSVQNMSATTEKSSGAIAGAFGKIAAAAAALGGAMAILSFGKATVEAAASAAAIESQFEQAFKGVESEATAAIDAMSKKFNIMPDRLKQPMNSLQSYFLGVGMDAEKALTTTEQAMRIAANGAAYYDKSIEDVSASMKSFLMGNYMVGDSFGVNANLTKISTKYNEQYGGSFEDLSEAMKQSYLLEYIQDVYELNGAMADSADEMDQAEKEAHAYENTLGNFRATWKKLKAVIGQNFLEPVIRGMEKLMQWMMVAADKVVAFRDKVKALWDAFKSSPTGSSFLQAIGEWMRSTRSFIDTVLLPIFEKVKNKLKEIFTSEDGDGIDFMAIWYKIQEVVNWFNELKEEFLSSTFWNSLKEVLQPVIDWFGTLGEKFADLRNNFADSGFLSTVAGYFTKIKDAILEIDFTVIRDNIQKFIDKVVELWDVWTGSTTWTTFRDDVLLPIAGAFTAVKDEIGKFIDKVAEMDKSKFVEIMDRFKTSIKKFGDVLLEIDFGKINEDIATFVDKWLPLIAGIAASAASFAAVALGVFLWGKAIAIGAGIFAGAAALIVKGAGLIAGAIVFITSPVGIAIIAIGLLVAAGVWLWQNWDEIKLKAAELWASITAAWDGLVTSTSTAWSNMVTATLEKTAEIYNAVVAWFTSIGAAIVIAWDNMVIWTQEKWGAMVADVLAKCAEIYNAVVQWFTDIGTAIAEKYEEIKTKAGEAWQAIIDAIVEKYAEIVAAVDTAVENVLTAIGEWYEDMKQKGRDLLQGFIDGIIEKANGIASAVSGAFETAKSFITSFWDFGSPSKLTHQYGAWIMEGFAGGIIDKARAPIDAIKSATRQAAKAWDTSTKNISGASLNVAQKIDHVVTDNLTSAKPAVIRLAMGNSTYGAYVEDISGRQSHTAKLERRYLRE